MKRGRLRSIPGSAYTPIVAARDYNALAWTDGFAGNPNAEVIVPSDAVVIPGDYGALETARLHPLFVRAGISLVDLARWGHQQPGLPWELPQKMALGERVAA